jgi:hypothetical protein
MKLIKTGFARFFIVVIKPDPIAPAFDIFA